LIEFDEVRYGVFRSEKQLMELGLRLFASGQSHPAAVGHEYRYRRIPHAIQKIGSSKCLLHSESRQSTENRLRRVG